jgi:hypothetical protein
MLRNATLVLAIFLALGSSGLSTSAFASGGDGSSDNHFGRGLRGFRDISRDGYRGRGSRANGLDSRFGGSGGPDVWGHWGTYYGPIIPNISFETGGGGWEIPDVAL